MVDRATRSTSRISLFALGMALIAISVAGCGSGSDDTSVPSTGSSAKATKAVVTFSILDDVVQNVGGECVETTVLVGRDGDTHVYQPTPEASVQMTEAELIIANGLGFEPWLDDLYTASGAEGTRVTAMEGVTPLTPAEEGVAADPDHADEVDPHAWQNPENMRTATITVRDALIKANPACAAVITENAARYDAKLVELNTEIVTVVELIPTTQRILVTNHDSLGYFAKQYGFTAETALGAFSTESSDPSAARVAKLVDIIRASGVPAIFVENTGGSDLVDRLAKEAGVALAPPLYTDALGPKDSPGGTYIGMMQSNAEVISMSLAGK